MRCIKKVIVILCFANNSFAQSTCELNWLDTYRLEIISGFTIFGTHSIKLSEEGLLCRTTNAEWESKTDFFTFEKLDKEKFWKLQCFLYRNKDYFSNDTIIDNKDIIVDDRMPLRIQIRRGWGQYSKITYIDNVNDCDFKLDSLVDLTNALLPDKYLKQYSIKGVDNCR